MGSFYHESPGNSLRFGDVVQGFRVATPHVDDPACDKSSAWGITVDSPMYLAVMTPCCSIEKNSIALAPLVPIRPAFLQNKHFEEDLTRINGKVPPELSVSRYMWENKLSNERREELQAKGPAYAFVDCFIFESHDLLKTYTLYRKPPAKTIDIGHYMVDFKDIYRVNCEKIKRGANAPAGMKLLQLTVATRQKLRDKLALYFFGRQPCEKIKRDANAPAGMKLLQLTVATRQKLRDKLALYFGRPPKEDRL